MKNYFFISIVALLITFSLTNCKKNSDYNCYFYTTADTVSSPLFLYINEIKYGELPQNNNKLICTSDNIAQQTLNIHLYKDFNYIAVRDANGNTLSYAAVNFSISKRSYSIENLSGNGILHFNSEKDCAVIQLYH